MTSGNLIALEGIDGSGKTTAKEALKDRYDGDQVVFTTEPTKTWYGEAVQRSANDDEADELAELFLFAADHAAHLGDVILPELRDGKTVITDRYVDSRLAYQAVMLEDRFGGTDESLRFVKEIHEPWTVYPDATVYLDISAETGADRYAGSNKMERKEFLTNVREVYQQLAKREERFQTISGEQEASSVLEEIVEVTDPLVRD